MAKSMSASVSAADIWVRMRAWPFGTTGKKNPATNTPRSSRAWARSCARCAQHHRNDRRLPGHDTESSLLDAFAKATRMVLEQSAPAVGADRNLERLERSGGERGRERIGKEVGPSSLPQEIDDRLVGGDE